MPQKQIIEYAEGYVREVRMLNDSGLFSVEIEKLLSEGKWVRGGPSDMHFHLVKGITPESVNKKVKILIEVEETVDTDLET